MSTKRTAEIMDAYLGAEGLDRVADDAVYRVVGTEVEFHGREAIGQFLDSMYRGGIKANAKPLDRVIGEDGAAFEYEYQGTHVGALGAVFGPAVALAPDLAATGREVAVPFCVVYATNGERITSAHIYFPTEALRRQLAA